MKKAKLAALISLSLANIAGLCLVTFAWFYANLKISAPLDSIAAVALDDITVSHEIYAWDDDSQQGVSCQKPDGTYKFSLEQYDSYITERNATLSKVIRFELKREVVLKEGTSFGVSIPCSGLLYGSDEKMTNNISNIIRFRYFVDSSNNGTDPDTIYTNAIHYLDDNNVSEISFVELNDESGSTVASKHNVININGLQFDANSSVTYFFLEYNYSVDLINFYYEHSDMDAPGVDSLEGDEVQFVGDINRMVFGVSEGSNG